MPEPLLFDPLRFPTVERRLLDKVKAAEISHTMLVFVDPDGDRRMRLLRNVTADRGAIVECQEWRSMRELDCALARVLALPSRGSLFEVADAIRKRLREQPEHFRLVLDNADRLNVEQFRSLRDFHDDTAALIILAAGDGRVLEMRDDQSIGGQFLSRSITFDARDQ